MVDVVLKEVVIEVVEEVVVVFFCLLLKWGVDEIFGDDCLLELFLGIVYKVCIGELYLFNL